jgi:hypothetical protein
VTATAARGATHGTNRQSVAFAVKIRKLPGDDLRKGQLHPADFVGQNVKLDES